MTRKDYIEIAATFRYLRPAEDETSAKMMWESLRRGSPTPSSATTPGSTGIGSTQPPKGAASDHHGIGRGHRRVRPVHR